MDPDKRIVVGIPIEELWTREGPLVAQKRRDLSTGDIAGLLRAGPLQFVVADLGQPLRWVSEADRFMFWKSEVKPRVADPDPKRFYLADFPGHYAYVASEWSADLGLPIVLLETHH